MSIHASNTNVTEQDLIVREGFFAGVHCLLSPHCDERPPGVLPDLVIVHGISLPAGHFGTGHIADFFCGKLDPSLHHTFADIAPLRVSAHLLIDRQGGIIQFVSFDRRAWHAGVSSFQGREKCNDYSIGIELEGTDTIPYTVAQYACLEKVIRRLRVLYPTITHDRIAGHSEVAPGRKTDPGPVFDMDGLLARLNRE